MLLGDRDVTSQARGQGCWRSRGRPPAQIRPAIVSVRDVRCGGFVAPFAAASAPAVDFPERGGYLLVAGGLEGGGGLIPAAEIGRMQHENLLVCR